MADVSYAVNFLNVTYGYDDLGPDCAIQANPLLQLFKIEEEGGGSVEEKFYLGGPQGFSGNLADAQQVALTGGSLHFRWQHQFGKHEGSIQVEYEDIMQSRKAQAAANQALEGEMDKGFASEGNNLAQLLIGRAGLAGGVGTFNEAASGVYPVFAIRFTDPSDARKYLPGAQVVISTTDGTVDGDITGETGFVLRRDVSEGWIQVASLDDITTAANPGGWTDTGTFSVFRLGEYTDGSPSQIISSIERYLPSAVASDILENVDRSVDSALSGARLTAAEEVGSILQRARKLCNKMFARYGTEAKKKRNLAVILNSEDWGVAEEEMIAKVGRDVGQETEEGYEAFVTRTAMGATPFVSEPNKNKGRAFILDVDRLKLFSPNGKLFEPVKVNNNIVTLMPGRNTLEIRTIAKVATGLGAPYMHGTFSTVVS